MGEERREATSCCYYVGTHARYIYYIVRDVMWYCTVVTMMSSMTNAY